MADDTGAAGAAGASGAAAATPSRSVSFRSLHHQRRQSTSERISEILENARGRVESMGPDPGPLMRRHSPQLAADDEASADELTGIVSRGSGQSYQALQTSAGARARRSIYRRPSQTTVSEDEAPPAAQPKTPQGSGNRPGARDGAAEAEARGAQAWWRKPLGKFQSIELENKGSVARDHLALERTFLAWLRTSLAFASIGIAVTQLFRLNTSLSDGDGDNSTLRRMGRPLGATFLGISILTLLLGFRRYFRGQEWVMKGKFPASRGTVILIAMVALAIMLVSLVVVIVIHPAAALDP